MVSTGNTVRWCEGALSACIVLFVGTRGCFLQMTNTNISSNCIGGQTWVELLTLLTFDDLQIVDHRQIDFVK